LNKLPFWGWGLLPMKKLLFLFFINISLFAQHNIIPAPVSFESKSSMFMMDNRTSVDVIDDNADAKKIAELFINTLSTGGQKLAFKKIATPSQQDKVIYFEINKTPNPAIGNEGYVLDVSETSIRFSANQPAGLFYAMQTFRQLLPAQSERKDFGMMFFPIMACKITDYPRFGWRGLMLDVSRNFFTKDEVKLYIDAMARYKFNILHFHLTDDNGWRIEIKSLPKLTSVGAWRVQRIGHFGEREEPKVGEPTPNGGFYTHEDIKELVSYAAERQISIVPEIDVPGHSMAALAAYPELSCKKEPKMVNPGTRFAEWYGNGKFKMNIENTLNPSDEKVYDFLDKVFTEVAVLFPHPYIHVGGDEAYHGYWEADKDCLALMKKNNLKDGHELQSYFMKRVEAIVNKKGKKMIGWDEILEGGISKSATVMSWRGTKGGIEAAKAGNNVVMTPNVFAYIDFTQGDHTVETPIYRDLFLNTAYQFEPVPEGIDTKYILGGQANLWTEQIPTLRHAFYMTYPRAFATSESLWSPKEKKNWDNFVARTESHITRFDAAEWSIAKTIYEPIIKTKKEGDKLMCTITNEISGLDVYYTMDNTFPDKFTAKNDGKTFEIPTGNVTLRAISYRNGQPIGRMLQISREQLLKRAK
jgi:hexosaminidase